MGHSNLGKQLRDAREDRGVPRSASCPYHPCYYTTSLYTNTVPCLTSRQSPPFLLVTNPNVGAVGNQGYLFSVKLCLTVSDPALGLSSSLTGVTDKLHPFIIPTSPPPPRPPAALTTPVCASDTHHFPGLYLNFISCFINCI